MTESRFPQESKRFEIQAYRPPKDPQSLRHTHVAFSGSPRRHPFQKDKMILVVDPYSENSSFFEFDVEEIGFAEELANLATPEGESITMVRLWIKKGSIAIRSIPFLVEDTRR